MNKLTGFVICAFLVANCQLSIVSDGQNVPVENWRTHISFNSINSVSVGGNKVYAASENGVMIFDQIENSISTVTKLNGLSDTGITQVAYDGQRHQLLISYSNGNLDILRSNEIMNFDRLKTSTTVTGSKRINHIIVNNDLAYFATDFGLVVFDLNQLEVKETWRDLGPAGEKIEIYQTAFFNDSIFLATEVGVLAGDLDANLLDYNNWTRFNSGVFTGDIKSITTFNNIVYAAINSSGIYRYENGAWNLETLSAGHSFNNLTAGSQLMITEPDSLWVLSNPVAIAPTSITTPMTSVEDGAGKIWIADQRNGLISNKSGAFESYVADGPSFPGGLRLKYDGNSKMYAVSGGFGPTLLPLGKTEYLNSFSNGMWTQETSFNDQDLTDVEFSGNQIFISSFGDGIQKNENGLITFSDNTVSPKITAMARSSAGIWVTNYGSTQSLNLLKSDNTWESFSFLSITPSRYPTEIAVDYLGHVWMIINPAQGGGIVVFDKAGNRSAYLTEVSGSGGLPNRSVYSIAMDRDGFVWIGTAAGIAYFSDPSSVFNANVNAVRPIFENRFLLRDEKVTAIEIDGGNRKWMGTENGVWLFNAFGESQVHYFNSANSPLPSDVIVDIETDGKTGEVFFMTREGIVSFRSDATTSDAIFHNVKIFPNPVTAKFNGFVGISGLATDAFVKITDVTGKLIWQTQANGGTVAWDVRDYNGRHAATGMYLVFTTSQDGSESVVGKIAVVD
jgi:hypothetical protein